MHESVRDTAMTGVPDLADMLELLADAFDQRPLAQQQFVPEGQQFIPPIAFQFRDELDPGSPELLKQFLANITAVTEQFAPESLSQIRYRHPIIHITGCETQGEQVPLVMDDEVQLEAVEPTHAVFASLGIVSKHVMVVDAAIMADRQRLRRNHTDQNIRLPCPGQGSSIGLV